MAIKTPLTVITGSLGSGKTTLLKHILDHFPKKIAIVMNEFGEIAIDSKIIKGKNIEVAELAGGCVCCSLVGEFEKAIVEIIDTINPEFILLETTGIAEPDAIIVDVQDSLPMVRLDGIITLIDADLMIRFPELGHTTRMQIEDGDFLILNKTDLVSEDEIQTVENQLKKLNQAPIVKTKYCQLDPYLIFGLAREPRTLSPPHKHQLDYQSFTFESNKLLNPKKFESFLNNLPHQIYRAKGFINIPKGTFLLNFVNGRWELEAFKKEKTALVFIGKDFDKEKILEQLTACER